MYACGYVYIHTCFLCWHSYYHCHVINASTITNGGGNVLQVGIAGGNQDSIMKKTETIIDNWTPHWNEEFEFPLRVPELALLRIEVHEYDATDKDDFGGQTCLPVSELKRGIRTIPLYDKKGRELSPVKLLVQFSFIDS